MTTLQVLQSPEQNELWKNWRVFWIRVEDTPEKNQLYRLEHALKHLNEKTEMCHIETNGLDWLRELYPERLDAIDQLKPKSEMMMQK
jgi:hypothetical protein